MGRGCVLDWSGSGQGQVEGSCECVNEPSVSHRALVSQLVISRALFSCMELVGSRKSDDVTCKIKCMKHLKKFLIFVFR
jgi:hypothetical protein